MAIDGVAWRKRCLMGLVGCSAETPCVLHDFWDENLEHILARLRSVTLADLAQNHDPGVERFRAKHGLPNLPGHEPLAVSQESVKAPRNEPVTAPEREMVRELATHS